MRFLQVMLLLMLWGAAGCARGKGGTRGSFPTPSAVNSSQPDQKLIVTPDTQLAGKIVKVNPAARFVVLVFPVGHLPALEQRLYVYRLGLRIGEIKVTGPQLDDKIVGDLVAGEARPGDEVRDR